MSFNFVHFRLNYIIQQQVELYLHSPSYACVACKGTTSVARGLEILLHFIAVLRWWQDSKPDALAPRVRGRAQSIASHPVDVVVLMNNSKQWADWTCLVGVSQNVVPAYLTAVAARVQSCCFELSIRHWNSRHYCKGAQNCIVLVVKLWHVCLRASTWSGL